MSEFKVIEVKQSVMENNDRKAEELRKELKANKTFLLNLMSSPGSNISAKKLYIMDREEKAGVLPDSACEFYLPLCDLVIITGSAAINKTMPRLLELSRNAEIILTGPTVTCCPELLKLGISRLSGRVVTECDAMLKAIVEKRTSVNRFSVAYQVP